MPDPTPDERIAALTKELAEEKARAALESARQTMDAIAAKSLADALKDQATSQLALGAAQAQLPFAQLQGIKAAVSGMTLPTGKEGTVKVAAGVAGTALQRSKRPMLQLLDAVASEIARFCPHGGCLVTEEQLTQASAAQLAQLRIDHQTTRLNQAVEDARRYLDEMAEAPAAASVSASSAPFSAAGGASMMALPTVIAGAYALGFTLDTINSLAKLLRTNRQVDLFADDTEAGALFGYLLESKNHAFDAKPGLLDHRAMQIAETLMGTLEAMGQSAHLASALLEQIAARSDAIKTSHAGDSGWLARIPGAGKIAAIKAEIDNAGVLLDSVHPAKKPEAFWTQVSGQAIAAKIDNQPRLIVDVKAQAVQVTESRWYASDRILAAGEVLVAYRVFGPDGVRVRSGVILKVSGTEDSRIDDLDASEWEDNQEE